MPSKKVLFQIKMTKEFKNTLSEISKTVERPAALILREALKTVYPQYFQQGAK